MSEVDRHYEQWAYATNHSGDSIGRCHDHFVSAADGAVDRLIRTR